MIHIVHSGNRSLYQPELDQLFRLRAKFFKQMLGWSALTVIEGRETDDYDDDQAIYLLAIEPDGEISVSVRLRPTADRSLLFDHFPHLVGDEDAAGLVGDDVWESCRYFATARARGPEGARRREELRLAMVEAAVDRGISRIVAITDVVFLPPLLQSSWTTRLLGLPAHYDEGECIALEIDCSEEALLRMRERFGVASEVVLDVFRDEIPPGLPACQFERLLAEQAVIDAAERREIARLARAMSKQDAQVIAKMINRICAIHEAEGEQAALEAISRLQALINDEEAPAVAQIAAKVLASN